MTDHIHSFGPKGRRVCTCGLRPEDLGLTREVRSAADVIEDALLPLNAQERREALGAVRKRGVMP